MKYENIKVLNYIVIIDIFILRTNKSAGYSFSVY